MNLNKELRLQDNHCLYTFIESEVRNDKVRKVEKVTKIIQGLHPNHVHISRLWQKHVQSFIKIGIKLYEELCSQGTHCL